MSSSNNNSNDPPGGGLNVCGMDFDNLCVHPDADGNNNELVEGDLENPMAYRHTQSGLQAFKEDMMYSMLEEQEQRAKLYPPKNKKKSWLGSLGQSKKPEIADDYSPDDDDDDIEDGRVGAAPVLAAAAIPAAAVNASLDNNNQQRANNNTKDEEATVVTHSEDSLEDSRIKATVVMISGCEDAQTSADVSNVSSFSLPDPNGRSGGACTSALLKVLYGAGSGKADTGMTFVQILKKMRTILQSGKYTQIPQLTSSRRLSKSHNFYLVPPTTEGTKRAVLIGINYTGQSGALSGCQNDCQNIRDYLVNVCGLLEDNIVVLMDDDQHVAPTRANILAAYQEAAALTKSGDALFCHYSGHGGRIRDDDYGEEEDGFDETLVPVDYASSGQIRDDDLYDKLVCAMPQGSTLVALMDCCHSATVLDLPYKYRADGTGSGFGATANSQLAESGMGAKYLMCLAICMVILFLVIYLPLFYAE